MKRDNQEIFSPLHLQKGLLKIDLMLRVCKMVIAGRVALLSKR